MQVHLPRLLAGRYRLERRRGRGGMGAVYEATDSSLERRVAVKVIRDFGVEARTRAFFVMELLEGATLREELIRRKRLDPARTLRILRAVCAAVDAAHRRQLIHRDLKPENIFLARDHGPAAADETAKVLDFGVAKFAAASDDTSETRTLGADTGPGVLLGTAAYMAPEQLLRESVSAQWDLWALSVVAYEMLTGALPFGPVSGADWRRDLLSGNFTPVRRHLPDASPRFQEFFALAFAASRAERPASAREFLSSLEEVVG